MIQKEWPDLYSGGSEKASPGMQTRAAMSSVKAKEVPRAESGASENWSELGWGGAGVH